MSYWLANINGPQNACLFHVGKWDVAPHLYGWNVHFYDEFCQEVWAHDMFLHAFYILQINFWKYLIVANNAWQPQRY